VSGKGQSKLKLSRNGNECKPLSVGFAVLFLNQASLVLANTQLLTKIPLLTLMPLVVVFFYAGELVQLSAAVYFLI